MEFRSRPHLRNQILQIIRERGALSVKQVHEEISANRSVSVNTVATVMNRLVNQGLFVRQGAIRHYEYSLAPQDSSAKSRALRSVENLYSEFGEAGLVHFVEAVDQIEPGALQKLESILRSRHVERDHE
jgi:predicted transcriptional regulator